VPWVEWNNEEEFSFWAQEADAFYGLPDEHTESVASPVLEGGVVKAYIDSDRYAESLTIESIGIQSTAPIVKTVPV